MCSRSLLDSNREDIKNIALLVLFRTTRITLHCSFHGSSLSNCCWMGCRRYSAANRLEVLLDEDDFRFSSRALERGDFLLLSQLHVTILALWSQCLFPRHGSHRSCLICVYVFVCVFVFIWTCNRHWHTTLAGWWSIHRSPRSWVFGAFATKQDIFFDLLSERTCWFRTHLSHRS